MEPFYQRQLAVRSSVRLHEAAHLFTTLRTTTSDKEDYLHRRQDLQPDQPYGRPNMAAKYSILAYRAMYNQAHQRRKAEQKTRMDKLWRRWGEQENIGRILRLAWEEIDFERKVQATTRLLKARQALWKATYLSRLSSQCPGASYPCSSGHQLETCTNHRKRTEPGRQNLP